MATGAATLAIVVLFTLLKRSVLHHDSGKMFFLSLILIGIIGAFAVGFAKLPKVLPTIQITADGIEYNSKSYRFSEIESIRFTGKQATPSLLFSGYNEGACITFNDGCRLFISDELYSNSPKIKAALYSIATGKTVTGVSAFTKILEKATYYKGILWYNHRLLLFTPLCIMLIYGCFKAPLLPVVALFGTTAVCFIMMLYKGFFYFGVAEHTFIVANHLSPFHKAYRLDDIKEVAIEYQHRSPNRIRVIFRDFTYRKFGASTLTNKKWLGLMKALEGYNITIRNESISV